MLGYQWNMFCRAVFSCLLVSSCALVEIAHGLLSCGEVAEEFAKRVGLADSSVPMSPVPGASLAACSGTLRHTHGASCCTPSMESQFLPASADYLREHIQISNNGLQNRITQSLRLYQEHLTLSVQEAHNRTSDVLSSLYKIPRSVHRVALDSFFQQLGSYLLSSDDYQLQEIIDSFFKSLFPIAFNYVLSDASKTIDLDREFNQCLEKHYNDIEPFGNVPTHFGRLIRYGFNRARIYTETLEVMLDTMDSTNNFVVHADCQKAISRLHFCPLCSGEVVAKPCRGMCLNVMRGCLSGISELSSSWDDLVVDFENLHLGMFKQNNAQELLAYLDGNITDALLQAMDDGSRIFTQVEELCRVPSHSMSGTDLYKKFFTPEGVMMSHPSNRIQSIRKDIASLIVELEESKGFYQRIADGLCRTPSIYEQEMQSHQCWNGSAVGRYLREVPEANIISQANYNMEVRITLIPDSALLQVKDTLAHMKRNLSALHNEELMLSDQSYKTAAVGSGGGYSTGQDVIIDDEDFVDRNSGSGSGAGSDDEGDKKRNDKPVYTSRPTGDRGQGNLPSGGSGSGSVSNEGRGKGSGGKPYNSSGAVSISMVLLILSTVIIRVCL